MKIVLFAKRGTTRDGKPYTRYISTLTTKAGERHVVSVKFGQGAQGPSLDACPMNITIPKGGANLSVKTYVDTETGELKESRTLWVTAWEAGEPYVDHSLDEYEDF